MEKLVQLHPAQDEVVLWDWTYRKGMIVDTGRRRAGVRAFKQALVDAGLGEGIVVDLPAWGDAVATRTKEFQAREGISPDGVIGRTTARHLLRQYGEAAAKEYGVPEELVNRQGNWESQNDPVCRGISGDEGRMQINPPSHPDVSLAQMWDPKWASRWAAGYLKGSWIYVGGDWDGAIAAYNIGGYYSKEWVRLGKPTAGGPELGSNAAGTTIDAWERATTYVERVRSSYY